jgi:hypothetical protein
MILPALVLASVVALSLGMDAEEAIRFIRGNEFMVPSPTAEKPCVLNQYCIRPEGVDPKTTPCPSVASIDRPQYGPYATEVVTSQAELKEACPFMDVT